MATQQEEILSRHNNFFYNIQHKRQLPIPYVLLSEWGVAWIAMTLTGLYFGLASFFYMVFVVSMFFYIYTKKFNYTIADKEELYVFLKIKKYLGIKIIKKGD